MAREWRSGLPSRKIHLQAPSRGTAHHTRWSLPHFDDVEGGLHTLPYCATSEEGATIVRLLLRRILDSSDDTLSPMAHAKCLPRQSILLFTSSSSKQPCSKEGTRNTVWFYARRNSHCLRFPVTKFIVRTRPHKLAAVQQWQIRQQITLARQPVLKHSQTAGGPGV